MFERIFSALGHAIGGICGTPVRSNRRPTGAALRNPADPIQAARIEAAVVKRARKADKLHEWACRSRHYNAAHAHGQAAFLTQRLDPLFVIHS